MTTVPLSFVVTVCTSFVPRSLSTSFAPGMSAPAESVTVTFKDPVDRSCALQQHTATAMTMAAKTFTQEKTPLVECRLSELIHCMAQPPNIPIALLCGCDFISAFRTLNLAIRME